MNLPPQAAPVRRPGPGQVCEDSRLARPAPGHWSGRFEPWVLGGDPDAPQAYTLPSYEQMQDQAAL